MPTDSPPAQQRELNGTVLLVDDERQVTRGLAALLHPTGLTVIEAHSAEEAMALLRRKTVDVVVSDERMPGMRGSEFLALVSRTFPETGRVLLTGQATVETAVSAINDGRVCKFLQKPCPPAVFRAAIEEALRAATQSKIAGRFRDLVRLEGVGLVASTPVAHSGPENTASHRFDPSLLARLSQREREIYDLVVDGLRLSQIAASLFISPHTARNHLKAIFRKLEVHSQAEMLDRGRAGGGPP